MTSSTTRDHDLAVVATLLCLTHLATPASAAPAQFAAWLEGDFNNHEQVWQQAIDQVDVEQHLHSSIRPVKMHDSGARLLYMEDRDGPTMQRLSARRMLKVTGSGDTVILRIYTPQNPREASRDTLQGWQPLGACDTRWSLQDGVYRGKLISPPACRRVGADLGVQVPAVNFGSLDDEYLQLNFERLRNDAKIAASASIKARKVRWFKGWAGVKKNKVDPDAADDEWIFASKLRTHNEGYRFPLLDKDGSESGYEIQLARLLQQQAQVEVLVLKLFRRGEESAFSYSWTSTDASRAGINLRWIQTGWTAETGE